MVSSSSKNTLSQIQKHISLTSYSYIQCDSYIHIQVLGLDSKEDRAALVERGGVEVTVHLGDWVGAVFTVDCHLSVTLVVLGRLTQEPVHALRALERVRDTIISIDLDINTLAFSGKIHGISCFSSSKKK